MDLRTATIQSNSGKLTGLAVAYGSRSQDLGGFVEIIEPGAFSEHLSTGPDVRALFEHDGKELLGRTTSGTLKLSESAEGLRVEIDPPNTRSGNDCKELVSRGDINGMSFGFIASEDRWDFDSVPAVRYVTRAELREVTVTATPAYKASSVALRSLEAHKPSEELNTLWIEYLGV